MAQAVIQAPIHTEAMPATGPSAISVTTPETIKVMNPDRTNANSKGAARRGNIDISARP